MRQLNYTLFFILFGLICKAQSPITNKQIIVKFKSSTQNFQLSLNKQKMLLANKIDSIHFFNQAIQIEKHVSGKKESKSYYTIQFSSSTNLEQVIEEYINSGLVEYAEHDQVGTGGGTPNDQYFSRQWSLSNNGTFPLSTAIPGADIQMKSAWDIEQGDTNIVVAIIDSGNKLDHPEFAGRIWTNKNEIPNNSIDDDLNGYVDDFFAWDFVNLDNMPSDDLGHGTCVAGIVGANANNSIGYAGVDWKCKLMNLKVLNSSNSGLYSWFSDAIYYAVNNGAKVINMSLGGSSVSTTLQNAVTYALDNGVTIVACMMNTNSSVIYYPAAYPGVIAVGSTNPNDKRTAPFFWSTSSGSNYGNHISVVAPGNYIYALNHLSNTNYNGYWGGTSQAAPHVAGLASLLLSQNNSRTPAQIKAIIESSAEDTVGDPIEDVVGWDRYYGYGRINAYKALLVNQKCYSTTNNQISICQGDSIFLQGAYRLNAGIYTDTFSVSKNCDSISICSLIIGNQTVSSLTESACNRLLWNNKTYSKSGIYFDTIPNMQGCDSIITLTLDIISLDSTLRKSGDTIFANQSGAAYQWLDCNKNFEQITGEGKQYFVLKKSGTYAARISKNICSITSGCLNAIKTNILNLEKNDFIQIFPNPTNGIFTVETSLNNHVDYEIFDLTGKLILKGYLSENSNEIDISEKEMGIYLLKINGQSFKIMKN
jgi:subtilisin family serine protease